MGVVYMAEQKDPVKRRVALKIIKPGMDTKQVVARFEAERQTLAMMDHPNIAKVHDAGTTETGRPYFVMELVNGIPITEYCDRYKLSTRRRLKLFATVCRAVQHAHQKGIIHRDLKPTNVLVTRIDGAGVPKIIDFGVAKAINREQAERTAYTQFAQLVGTPLYMKHPHLSSPRLMCAGVLVIVGLSSGESLPAATITYSAGGVTGMTDFDFGGTTYDLSFHSESFDDVYGSSTPTWWGTTLAGMAPVTTALAGVLDAEGIAPADFDGWNGSADSYSLMIPYSDDPHSSLHVRVALANWSPPATSGWAGGWQSGALKASPDTYRQYVVFTEAGETSPVPEPSTLALLGIGGVCMTLAGVRRRHKTRTATGENERS